MLLLEFHILNTAFATPLRWAVLREGIFGTLHARFQQNDKWPSQISNELVQ